MPDSGQTQIVCNRCGKKATREEMDASTKTFFVPNRWGTFYSAREDIGIKERSIDLCETCLDDYNNIKTSFDNLKEVLQGFFLRGAPKKD